VGLQNEHLVKQTCREGATQITVCYPPLLDANTPVVADQELNKRKESGVRDPIRKGYNKEHAPLSGLGLNCKREVTVADVDRWFAASHNKFQFRECKIDRRASFQRCRLTQSNLGITISRGA
jgi:hypothetical protein